MRSDRALLAAACALLLCSCADELGCDVDGVTRDLGGTGLMDCGIGRSDVDAVDACAVGSFRRRDTFRALYETKDGSLSGIVHAAGDKYYAVRASSDGDEVERAQCEGASIVTKDGRSYVQCDKPGTFTKACN